MKTATQAFSKLVDYEIGEVTAAATFYLAEIYAHFSKALMSSERPEKLSPLELEQYELAIEEQAYPFEEKAIAVHESNLKLISRGVYNEWIDKSLQKLAEFLPARYAKSEETSGIVSSLETYIFEIDRPVPPAPPESEPGSVADTETMEPAQTEEAGSAPAVETEESAQVEGSGPVAQAEAAESATAGEAGAVATDGVVHHSGDRSVPPGAAVQ